MYSKLFFFLTLVCSLHVGLSSVYAQNRTIKGNVQSTANEPLTGVSVKIKNSEKGTSTDAHGNFSLTLSSDAILVISSVGYKPKEVVVGQQTNIQIYMEASSEELDQLVIIGYGQVKRSDLTGSVAQVKAEQINAFPTTNVVQALNGRAAGVQVSQNSGSPGGSVSVRIRGTNSVQGGNEPLYVVDGFPLSGSSPTLLNNADVESVEILKDASATAIYGSRGANGVIIITTKKGKSGTSKVDFESRFSTQSLRKKLDLMDATEYAKFYNLQAANDKLAPRFTDEEIASLGKGFDWQGLAFQNAPMQDHNLNISGGNEKTQFVLGGGLFRQEGIVKSSYFNRYSMRTNVTHKISDKLTVDGGITLSKLSNNIVSNGGGRGNSLFSSILSAYPTIQPYNESGTYTVLATAYPWGSNVMVNPLNFINEQYSKTDANRVLANAAFSYRPIPELTFRISGGVENREDKSDGYKSVLFVNSQGEASVSNVRELSKLSENTVTYANVFNEDHDFTAMAGFTYQDFLNTGLSSSGTGFLTDVGETYDLISADNPGIPKSNYTYSTLLSFIGRVNYSYKKKYLATVSFRTDGSSRYSEGRKWGYFPSGAISWRLSEEDFLKNVSFITDLKIRAGYGRTGSQAIAPYTTLNQLTAIKAVFDDALYTAYTTGTVLPQDLKWETTAQTDFGLDGTFLDGKLHFVADYYVKKTTDLLNTVNLPSSMGYLTTVRNVGSVQNKGVEFTLDMNVLEGKFSWNIGANIGFNRNKVLKLYEGKDIIGGPTVTFVNDRANILREGQPIGRFWGYIEDGYDSSGQIKYKDIDGDSQITSLDKTYIGDPNPDFIYGFNSEMSYKNFGLSFFIQGSQGNDLFNTNAAGLLDYGFGLNMPKEVLYSNWSPNNPNSKYPIVSRVSNGKVSDRFVEDGSYLRLKDIQLSYQIPIDINKTNWIKGLRIYVSGQNLLTFTDYSWWDPEVNSQGGANSTSQGFDYYSYPTAKTITFGVNASF